MDKFKRVEMLRDTVAGKALARTGSVCELEEGEANYLIATGFAKEVNKNTILKRVPKPKPAPPKEEGK